MHGQGYLELFLMFLLAAVVAVPLFRRFGLGAVLGYLFAGVVMGPFGLRLVKDAESMLAFVESRSESSASSFAASGRKRRARSRSSPWR